jgi:hypothetical protein
LFVAHSFYFRVYAFTYPHACLSQLDCSPHTVSLPIASCCFLTPAFQIAPFPFEWRFQLVPAVRSCVARCRTFNERNQRFPFYQTRLSVAQIPARVPSHTLTNLHAHPYTHRAVTDRTKCVVRANVYGLYRNARRGEQTVDQVTFGDVVRPVTYHDPFSLSRASVAGPPVHARAV